jgi:hypothetical protein
VRRGVINVTDAAHPVAYRFTSHPSQPQEFGIDVPQARLTFGGPQRSGDTLSVAHRTVTWRDDIEGAAYRGVMTLDCVRPRIPPSLAGGDLLAALGDHLRDALDTAAPDPTAERRATRSSHPATRPRAAGCRRMRPAPARVRPRGRRRPTANGSRCHSPIAAPSIRPGRATST